MRVALVTFIVLVAACAPSARLSGTELDRATAPDFSLTDGTTGKTVTLSALRGNVVAMAFLYTRCPDICPLTAAQFRAAQQQLGADAARVRFVAISVDPDGDTPANVTAFSAAHDLSANWHYLIGARSQLEPVWSAYGIGAFNDSSTMGAVVHNDAIYVLDTKGREREIVHSDVALKDLVADLRGLIRGD